jgi:hypothetical protein
MDVVNAAYERVYREYAAQAWVFQKRGNAVPVEFKDYLAEHLASVVREIAVKCSLDPTVCLSFVNIEPSSGAVLPEKQLEFQLNALRFENQQLRSVLGSIYQLSRAWGQNGSS